MITLRRLGFYLIAWILLIFVTALISSEGLFIKVDEWVYAKYYATNEVEDDSIYTKKIVLVDIPHHYKNYSLNLEQKRNQTARLLSTINSMVISNEYEKKPIIILDIGYSNTETGIDALKQSLSNLKENKIKVYAAYPVPDFGNDISFRNHDNAMHSDLYDKYFEGRRLHVDYNKTDDTSLRSYNSFIELKRFKNSDVSVRIESLINRVANDKFDRAQTDFNNLETESVNTKNLNGRFEPRTYEFTDTDTLEIIKRDYEEFNKTINLNGSFIIIGQEDADQKKIGDDEVFGAYLLASGIVKKLSGNKSFKESIDDVPVQLGMAFLFALLVCVFFALIYKYLKSLQTKPLLIGSLSFISGILLLMVTGFAFSRIGSIIRPALPGVSMFWASFLAWRFANKFLVTGIIEGSGKYDVFISYSFGDSRWVKQFLHNPLSKLKKSDGSKLEIFFAEQSIQIGELFVSKYMKAIVNSKLFIPVMSREYYNKNHCKNEMDLAVKRKIEELLNIYILAFDYKYVPDEFTNMLLIDINKRNDFMTPIQDEIMKIDKKQNVESDTNKQKDLDKKSEIEVDTKKVVKIKETKHQDDHPIAKLDTLTSDQKPKNELDTQETKIEDSEKEQVETITSNKENKEEELDKDKKDKKEKKKKKKKRSNKKDKKEKEKKAKKRSVKKDKKEKKKKSKKRSDKKNKKEEKKKSKKRSDKKNKIKQKKKAKKRSVKKNKKQQKKKVKKRSDKKNKIKQKKKSKKRSDKKDKKTQKKKSKKS